MRMVFNTPSKLLDGGTTIFKHANDALIKAKLPKEVLCAKDELTQKTG